jgi:hypothetical protein
MTRPLKTWGGVPSLSIISKTLLDAFESESDATQTSATKSRDTSPEFKVFSAEMTNAPVAVDNCSADTHGSISGEGIWEGSNDSRHARAGLTRLGL